MSVWVRDAQWLGFGMGAVLGAEHFRLEFGF